MSTADLSQRCTCAPVGLRRRGQSLRRRGQSLRRRGQSLRRSGQCGSVLIEFAFVSLLMYMLLAVTVDFGRLFFTAQAVQDAARSGARELSVIPLPPDMTFDEAMADPQVRARVFQREHLVIDLDAIPGGLTLNQFFDTLPLLNKMLRPVMIFDTVAGQRLLRYPGALLEDGTSPPTHLSVAIPFVEGQDANGVETIRWVPVIEEIRNPNFPGVSPFSMTTPAGSERGLVALRINYPYQASMLSGYRTPPGGPGAPNLSFRVRADDSGVVETNALPSGHTRPMATAGAVGPYAGEYGLGRMFVAGETVRPFRKLLSAQMIFRREVFE